MQGLVSCEIPHSVLRHETFHFKLIQKPLVLFSCDSSFCPSILKVFCLFGRNPAVFLNLNSFQHLAMLFCAHLLRPAAVHQFVSHSLPRITRAFPALNQNSSLPVFALASAKNKSFVQHCSCFCQLIRLLVAFRDKTLKVRPLFLIFICAVCPACAILPRS